MISFAQFLENWANAEYEGRLDNPTHSIIKRNEQCGDRIEIDYIIEDSKIKDVKYRGHGCVLCVGTAATLTAECIGLTIDELQNIDLHLDHYVVPNRKKCIVLAIDAIREAAYEKTDN